MYPCNKQAFESIENAIWRIHDLVTTFYVKFGNYFGQKATLLKMSFWSCYLCSAINEVTQWMRELALVPLLPLLGFGPWHLDDITSAKQQQLYKNLFESNLNTDASIGLYRYSATYTSVALGFPLLRGHHHLGNSRMVLHTYGERKLLAIQWKT